MITARQLTPDELATLKVQPWQRKPEFELTPDYCEFICANSVMPTGIWIGDKLVAAGGAFEIWDSRAEVWMLLSEESGISFVGVHRVVQRFIASMPYARLETTCELGWPQAKRWLEMLGFTHEATARKYMPGGRDVDIYVRIQ